MQQTPVVAQLRKRYLSNLKAGTNVIETIKVVRRGKTHKQCKAIFGLAFAVIVKIFEDNGWDSSIIYNIDIPTGVPVNSDMLIDFFYSLHPTYQDDKRITLSKMTTVEAADFYEKISNYAASQWSIVIPDPDPEWKTKHLESA